MACPYRWAIVGPPPCGSPLAKRLFARSPATILAWGLRPIAVYRFPRSFDPEGASWGSSLAQRRYVKLFAAAWAWVINQMSVRDFPTCGATRWFCGARLCPRVYLRIRQRRSLQGALAIGGSCAKSLNRAVVSVAPPCIPGSICQVAKPLSRWGFGLRV